MRKADLQAADSENPDPVAVNQKAIRINDGQHWLYAAVDPQTNSIRRSVSDVHDFVRLFPAYTIPIARESLGKLAEKRDVEDAPFLVDDADDPIGELRREHDSYRVERHDFRISVERVFKKEEQRTSSFSNCFSHVGRPTAETRLRTPAV